MPEFMILPVSASSFGMALRMGSEGGEANCLLSLVLPLFCHTVIHFLSLLASFEMKKGASSLL